MRKALRYILILLLVQLSLGGMAQFRKALSSPGNRRQSDDAMFNIGLIGGPSTVHWHHFDVSKAEAWYLEDYTPELQLGYTAGLYFEAILTKHLSTGINLMYSRNKTDMQFSFDQFPYDWEDGNLLFKQRHYEVSSDYHTVEAVLPVTYYLLTSKDPVRPYFYLAPSVSYIATGNLHSVITDSFNNTQSNVVQDTTVAIVPDNHARFNFGATAGIGTQFRISMDYYYFLIKMGVQANWNFLNTFTEAQQANEFNNKRYDANTSATVTFIFPLKKRLFDACHIMR